MTEATLMIKTVARPDCLKELLKSARLYFPTMPILVADDSRDPYPEIGLTFGAEYHALPFDTSAPGSYNHLMQFVETPYVILADDDFVFTEHTRIDRWVPWLESDILDLMGGPVIAAHRNGGRATFVGNFYTDHNVLKLGRFLRDRIEYQAAPVSADVVMNWWIARTEAVRRCPWDAEQKVFRHLDWFLTAKEQGLRIGYHPGVPVLHDHGRGEAYYGDLRHGRMKEYIDRFCRKRGYDGVDEDA